MTVNRDDILDFLDRELEIDRFRDYGPIGLQVAGRDDVGRVAVAVSSTLEVFQRAESFAADLLIVHHGLFWDGDSRVVDALMRRRLETLFRTGITLAAYHLPLDAHRELGNNAELARMLGVTPEDWFMDDRGAPLAVRGRLAEPLSLAELAASLKDATGRPPLAFPGGRRNDPDRRDLQRRRGSGHPARGQPRPGCLDHGRAVRGLAGARVRARHLVRRGRPLRDRDVRRAGAGERAAASLRRRDDLPRRPEPRMRIRSNSLPSVRGVGYA